METISGNTVFHFTDPSTYFLFQSPFSNIFDIQAYANVWAVPCDRTTDCEDGSDESIYLCGIPKEIVSYCLSSGYGILFLIMLVALVYIRKTYVTYFRPLSKDLMLISIQYLNNRSDIEKSRVYSISFMQSNQPQLNGGFLNTSEIFWKIT